VLVVTAAGEPYHIDELRQTRSYSEPFDIVVKRSFEQEQPPLDPVINALAQRLIGVGDVKQRLLSIAFGVGSLILVAAIAFQAGMSGWGAATAVAVTVFTPALTDVTAYARPYALPLFLMLLFAWSITAWLRNGSWRSFAAAASAALLLPLSRTAEPAILLGVAAFTLVIIAFRVRSHVPRGRAVMALGLVCVSLVVVAVPVLARLRTDVGQFTELSSSPTDRASRLLEELPAVVTSAFPQWFLVIGLILIALSLESGRAIIRHHVGLWLLIGTAIGFAVAFFLFTPAQQSFYERYTFTWVVPAAFFVGLAVTAAMRDARIRLLSWVVSLTASAVLIWGAWGTLIDVTRAERADWRRTSELLVDDLPRDTALIFDAVTSLDGYRTPFAGYPRYTGVDHPIPLTLQLIRDPSRAQPGANTAVVLLTEHRFDVPNWVQVGIDRFFTVYLPEAPHSGLEGLARSAEEVGGAMDPDLGAVLLLTAASLWQEYGNEQRAVDIVRGLLANNDLSASVLTTIEDTALQLLIGD
jgi:hypothetical protein